MTARHVPQAAGVPEAAGPFVSPQAMNLVIRDLERRGLVHREPDSDGGRVLRANLTRAGLATLVRCDHALDDIEQAMLCDLGDEDHQVLAGYLTACAQALHSRPDPVRATNGVRP